jgi:PiT family inorganic phosphate transporter
MTTILLLVIVAALLFDYVNGWNDSANAIATVISTRVLSPLAALTFAAVLNFVGALVSDKVAKTIGGGLVNPQMVTEEIVLAAMLAAAAWVAVCTLQGLPISGSHALIGGLIGATVTRSSEGWNVLQWGGVKQVLVAMVASPLVGFLAGYLLLVVVYWIAFWLSRHTVRRVFSGLQMLSSGAMAFTHGMNDAQKVMGVITLALYTSKQIPSIDVPLWVKLLCATVMGIGTAAGGWRVIQTLGMKLAHMGPAEGFAAEAAAAGALFFAADLGVPVSSTHTITGSIMGVGAARRAKAVKWSIGKKILYAWVFTLPATAALASLLALVIA